MSGPATGRVWIEAALNGPWTRARQPGIPVSVEAIVAEGVACARAGAAIVHVHAYDVATGRQRDDADLYAAILEGIRGQVDAIVYPTIPFGDPTLGPRERFAAIEALARRGLLEWAVVDPGSVNIAAFDEVAAGRDGFVYLNPDDHLRHGLALAREHGFHPGYAIYEPGFLRAGAAFAASETPVPQPVYRFMFSDAFTFGFPPRPWALDAYRALLAEAAPGAPWMVAGLQVELGPLVEAAVALGGHVRTGLEDAPFGCPLSNLALVEHTVAAVRAAGGEPASAAEVRRALAG